MQVQQLTGTEGQVAWANRLRQEQFDLLMEWAMGDCDYHRSQVTDDEYDQHRAKVLEIVLEVVQASARLTAKYWIDNRPEAMGAKIISELRAAYNQAVRTRLSAEKVENI